MLFHTVDFLAFFGIFYLLYLLLNGSLRLQNILILLASYLFYSAWDERFLTLIMTSTVTDYVAGLGASGQLISRKTGLKLSVFLALGTAAILFQTFTTSWIYMLLIAVYISLGWIFAVTIQRQTNTEIRRHSWLVASLIVNLGLLCVFKYFNFFSDSFAALAGRFGLELNWTTLTIILPVGISFYTFQTLSYTLDIYRGKLKPTHHFVEFAAFVAFFPQLVAGPIERASNFLPQFFKKRIITSELISSGLVLFFWGMYKKTVVADNLSPIADRIFADPASMSAGELWAGLLAFTFQIYCDFSGYSDMARGIARMMGFELMLNFNIPYFSRTPSEFWRRWHISLSSWLRDYLYIGLGGNRSNEWLTYRNLMLTMVLGGLWHGAAWTFVIWGFYQGLVLVIYRMLNIDRLLSLANNNALLRLSSSAVSGTIFFLLTMLGWLIFRAENVSTILTYLPGLFSLPIGGEQQFSTMVPLLIPLLLVQIVQAYCKKIEVLNLLPMFVRFNMGLFAMCSIFWLSFHGEVQFIYFDF